MLKNGLTLKKFYYFLTGFVFLFVMGFNTVVYAQYPTYKCEVKEGTELLWEVKVVDTTGLKETLGANYSSKVTINFGSIELGETKKEILENVYDNKTLNLGLGSMNTFTIVTQIWDWTNTTFSSTPKNTISFSTFYDPEDVQALSEVNRREVSIWDW